MRLPTAILGTLSIPLAFSVAARLVGRRAAWWTAGLVAASPYLVYFSQEARNYALFGLLALLATRALLRLLAEPGAGRGAAYGMTALLGLLTHYFFAFVLLAHGLHALSAGPRARRAFLIATGGAGLLFAPWAGWVASHWESQERAWMHPPPLLTGEALQRMAGGYGLKVAHLATPAGAPENSWPAIYLPALLLGAAALAGLAAVRRRGALPLLLGLLLLPPVLLTILWLAGGPALAADRTYIFAAPFLYLLAGTAAAQGRRGALLGAALLLVFATGVLAWHVNPRAGKEPWDRVAAWLDERAGPQDVVLAHKPYLTMALHPYLRSRAALVPFGAPDPAALDRPEVRGARRIFLVLAHHQWDTKERWVEILDERFRRREAKLFPKLWGIRVYEWEGQ